MMQYALLAACAVAFGYQLTAIVATLRQILRRDPATRSLPPISILKPVRGLDPGFYEAIRSHATQDYPDFEILFGAARMDDPALDEIRRLQAEVPRIPIRIIHSTTGAPNGKVGVLIDLAREARHRTLLVNDSDIRLPPGYLRGIVAPLEDPQVGVVTCLYRATGRGLPGIFEALGIATDFAPSALVAPLVGINEFGLGSTLLFRRADLASIGGFEAIAPYIADDYQLAKRITQLGRRVHLAKAVVETALQAANWADIWHHQVRWHRTIRVSRGAYAGLPATHASLWALVAMLAGLWWAAAALLAARLLTAVLAGWGVLGSPLVLRWLLLVPLRDLFGVAVWLAGLTGHRVRWRDQILTLSADGRILQ